MDAPATASTDILVWNHVTRRRRELSPMGIRVNAEALKKQLRLTDQRFLQFPYHQAIVNHERPLSVGGASARRASRCRCCARPIPAKLP
jgi:asparagine synthetase A